MVFLIVVLSVQCQCRYCQFFIHTMLQYFMAVLLPDSTAIIQISEHLSVFFVPSNQLISTELPKSIYVEPFQTNIFRGTSDKMAQSSLQFTNELSTANAIIVQMFCLIVPLSVGFNVHPRGIWCEQTLTHSPKL